MNRFVGTLLAALMAPLLPKPATAFDCPDLALAAASPYFEAALRQGRDGTFFRDSPDLREFVDISETSVPALSDLTRVLASVGTRLLVVPVPPRGVLRAADLPDADRDTFDPARAAASLASMRAVFAKAGVLVVDLTPGEVPVDGVPLTFGRDTHWTPEGAALAARRVAEAIKSDPDYASLPKTSFVTSWDRSVRVPLDSKFRDALQDFCNDDLPVETMDAVSTRQDESESLDDFLDDAAESQITLVGTSFSDQEVFNFAGFIQQETGLSVTNYAIAGGGALSAFLTWARTAANRQPAPRYLVWEFPVYMLRPVAGQGDVEFRRLGALARGPCSETARVLTTQVTLGDDAGTRVEIPASVDVSGPDVVVEVISDSPMTEGLMIEIAFRNGDIDFAPLLPPERGGSYLRDAVSLPREIVSPLAAVTVIGTAPSTATLSICRKEA